MGKIEKIKQYIERTKIPGAIAIRYDCYPRELLDLLSNLHPYAAMSLAFAYGKAKGYRAGKKAEGKV